MVGDFGFLIRTIPFCRFFTTFFLLEMSDRYRPMNVNCFYGWCKHILILGAHFIRGLGCLVKWVIPICISFKAKILPGS